MTTPQCFMLNMDGVDAYSSTEDTPDSKPPVAREKIMSYEEKLVGSTPFFKCEACPYMALAEDDIKFHLFTVHPDLAKHNGLADNIQVPCPGCTSVFDAEESLRTHLRNHHKMGIKDVKKMVKSLLQIALKNAKLKKEEKVDSATSTPVSSGAIDDKIQVIEIVPDIVNPKSEILPKGVAFISVDELQKMSTPNFGKIDPKEIIQEASINIVYTNEIATKYLNVSTSSISSTPSNMKQVTSVTPDLISSIQPRSSNTDSLPLIQSDNNESSPHKSQFNQICQTTTKGDNIEKKPGMPCSINGCNVRLSNEEKLHYHRQCHRDNILQCPECSKVCTDIDPLHTHLWKIHAIDMELPTCNICGYKTYKRYRLTNIHMKCHGQVKAYPCVICSKSFKNVNQLSKHKLIHTKDSGPVQCTLCKREFSNERRLKCHVATVHEKLKPFKCTYCEYTASRKTEIKLHLRSHTGDKPYACNDCSYRSADHNSMRRHKKTHSKESVYKCKYCPYSSIQSTVFASHMISKHPKVDSNDIYRCPYCAFRTVNKDKYVSHLTNHKDKEGIQLLIERTTNKTNKPSWTIPSETRQAEEKIAEDTKISNSETSQSSSSVNTMPIKVYDCDSISERLPKNYTKDYCTDLGSKVQQNNYSNHTESKEDNNSDCLISESSNDTLIDRPQYPSQHQLQNMTYDATQSDLHFLNPTVSIEQNLLQNTNVNSIPPSHSPINSIMFFPIRLPQTTGHNNVTLKAADKISLSMNKVIKPTQILPVPSSSNSPVNIINELDGAPRKKPKISVKSNLILKGPDQVNMFHSQQQMAFKRLEDNERYGLGSPVTFNNLITTQFMQLQPEGELNESPSNIIPYPQDNMLVEPAPTPVDNDISTNPQIFPFPQINVNSMTMLPPQQKIPTTDPTYVKIEATIKQNTQSPSLERMCNANILSQPLSREYKASPPLEEINKNMNIIKNELKPDSFYNISLNNATANPSIIDQYLLDNIIGEQYSAHMDLSTIVIPETSDDQQNDVIEIDDNSDDNKLLPRFDMNFPLESLYLMHNDFHFLENDNLTSNIPNDAGVSEINRIGTDVSIMTQKDITNNNPENVGNEFPNFIHGKKDPMMNNSIRGVSTNKINVKNIELMKN